MDDISCILDSENYAKELLSELNTLSNSIKFTLELATNDKLPFLDLHISRAASKLSTSVYRKPTDTGLYLNFNSLAPKKYKVATINSLLHRAFSHNTSWFNFHNEITHIRKLLINNSYPINLIDFHIKSFLDKKLSNNNVEPRKVKDSISLALTLPLQFRGSHTIFFTSKLRKLIPELFIYFTSVKLRSIFSLTPSNSDTLSSSSCVYQYKCANCQSLYIGYTKRFLIKRINEHSKKELFRHHSLCNNTIPFHNCFQIIDRHGCYKDLLILESMHIAKNRPALNTQVVSKRNNIVLLSSVF